MIKSAMVTLFKRTEKKEKEMKQVKEIHQTHQVHHVHKVESTTRITAVSKEFQKVEAQAMGQISKLSEYMKTVKKKVELDEAARLKSNAAVDSLQEQTMSLFKKVATQSDKMDELN